MKTMHVSLCVGQIPFKADRDAEPDPADYVFEFLRKSWVGYQIIV